MKRRSLFFAVVISCSLILAPSLLYAGNGNNPNPNNGSSNSNANNPDKNFNNNKDGNGKGTGQGTGNVPIPADGNNVHGMVNNGGNYNNGVRKQTDVPFDGGIGLLIAAGIGVRAKKAYDKRKRGSRNAAI